MTRRYLVVDQNVLRKPELSTRIEQEKGTRFVLPDLSFLEMTKSPQWENTLRGSLEQLATVPNRMIVAHSVNEALRRELRTLESAASHMHDAEATTFVRELLAWVHTGVSNSAIDRYRADPESHRMGVAADHLDHQANKAGFAGLIESTQQHISEALRRQLRQKVLTTEDRLDIVHTLCLPADACSAEREKR